MQPSSEGGEGAGLQHVVIVEEEDVRRLDAFEAEVAGRRPLDAFVATDELDAVSSQIGQPCGGVIGRRVVDDDHAPVDAALGEDTRDRLLEQRKPVASRDDDRCRRVGHGRHPVTVGRLARRSRRHRDHHRLDRRRPLCP